VNSLRLGYQFLDRTKKQIYEGYEKALLGGKDAVEIEQRWGNIDYLQILNTILGDYPDIIWIDKTGLKVSSTFFGKKAVGFCKMASGKAMIKMNEELNAAVKQFLNEINDNNIRSDYNKLKYIYEYLQDTVAYDSEEFEYSCRTGSAKRPESHTAYGALINGRAVCDGIAGAFSLLAQSMGIGCMVVGGTATHEGTQFMEHAWNIIRMEDKYYHVDVTWDLDKYRLFNQYSYNYFCIDDKDIGVNHRWQAQETPACTDKKGCFYVRNNLFAATREQIDEILDRQMKSRKKLIRIKLSEDLKLPGDMNQFFSDKIMMLLSKYNGGQFEYLWDKSTRVFVAKMK